MTPKSVESSGSTIVIKNLPDVIRCCGVEPEDDFVHLGMLFSRITACGRPMGDVLLADDGVITCPNCVAEITYRKEHPEVTGQSFGVVTHKQN